MSVVRPVKHCSMLHNEWHPTEGRHLFSTSICSEPSVRHSTQDNPVFKPSSYLSVNDVPMYAHDETCVTIDAGYCAYLIYFRHDGTVDSQAFA